MNCTREPAGTWNGGAAGEVLLRYGRILALSCAIELASSEDVSRRIAKAIRGEAGALCDAYSDWCSYLLRGMKDPPAGSKPVCQLNHWFVSIMW
jgi:hypothetical protein